MHIAWSIKCLEYIKCLFWIALNDLFDEVLMTLVELGEILQFQNEADEARVAVSICFMAW